MSTDQETTFVSQVSALSDVVDQDIAWIATGSRSVQTLALNAAKYLLDTALSSETTSIPYINELFNSLSPSYAPETRASSRKRKRTPPLSHTFPPTPLTSLYVEGMNHEQIWAQLDMRTKGQCETLKNAILEKSLEDMEDEILLDGDTPDFGDPSAQEFSEEEGSDFSGSIEETDEAESNDGDSNEDSETQPDELAELHQSSDSDYSDMGPGEVAVDSYGLNDGFFNLKAFNTETEEAEAMTVSHGRLDGSEDSSDDEPIDLFAPVDDPENFEEEDLENTEPYYKDFFGAPERQKSQKLPKTQLNVRFHEEVHVRKIKATGRGRPVSEMDLLEDDDDDDDTEEDDEGDGEEEETSSDEQSEVEYIDPRFDIGHQTIDRLKEDLFADDPEETNHTDLTQHEKRQAALQEQIAQLESENVGEKDWVLMGEATSRSRPQNSLLEEDLEFERVSKTVPVITEDVVRGLEERIKARILEGRFDDVVRIRPAEDKPFLPSRLLELSDQKSSQSLAQIYENEYISAQSGGDKRDNALQKEHEAISRLWEKICESLDALCNAHFVPKQPKASISTISNVASATIESALPTTQSSATMLAPEEIFDPSDAPSRARSEMTPGEKRMQRAKSRKAKRNMRDKLEKTVDKFAKVTGSVRQQKRKALDSVVKSGKGVTVVGKPTNPKKQQRTKNTRT